MLVRGGQIRRHACSPHTLSLSHMHAHTYTPLTCLIKTHPATGTQRCECFPWGAGHVHFEKGRRFNFFFPPPSSSSRLLIITEIARMHDPENKAESWESPPDASPSSVLLSIVRLPCWLPPTPDMSEVEAALPSLKQCTLGIFDSAPTTPTPEAEKKTSQNSKWLKTLPFPSIDTYTTVQKTNIQTNKRFRNIIKNHGNL